MPQEQLPSAMPIHKYVRYQPLGLPNRTWPDRQIDTAPLWCSVDLRDGNQALLDPMDLRRKSEMFRLLVRLGFKEIEIGFPTSSNADWGFVRHLASQEAIPDDVLIQVMSPIRTSLLDRTVECLHGIPKAILQVYNPTSTAQRRVVFNRSRAETKALALEGAVQALRLRDEARGTHLALQYAPESFTQTEPEFALEICQAVLDLWQPTRADDIRVNLPATVEAFPPQEFADRIEWMHRNMPYRDVITLSVHPHNDRGTAVAAAEAAVLAGADRIEGTLFGNGERTGNVCLITLAVNLFSQGVDPMLDLRDIDEVRRITEACNQLPVSHRHPWAGDLTYTSLAGSHQDAIAKGLRERAGNPDAVWDVPYLPIDPRDLGRDYQALIRLSNQSGKGGVAYLMRSHFGLELPRKLQIELSAAVQGHLDANGGEVTLALLWDLFEAQFATVRDDMSMLSATDAETALAELSAVSGVDGSLRELVQHPITVSARAEAGQYAAYAEVSVEDRVRWGAAIAATSRLAKRDAVAAAFSRAVSAGRRRAAAVASGGS